MYGGGGYQVTVAFRSHRLHLREKGPWLTVIQIMIFGLSNTHLVKTILQIVNFNLLLGWWRAVKSSLWCWTMVATAPSAPPTRAGPRWLSCLLLLVQNSVNHKKYSALSYKIGFVSGDLAHCRRMWVFQAQLRWVGLSCDVWEVRCIKHIST